MRCCSGWADKSRKIWQKLEVLYTVCCPRSSCSMKLPGWPDEFGNVTVDPSQVGTADFEAVDSDGKMWTESGVDEHLRESTSALPG